LLLVIYYGYWLLLIILIDNQLMVIGIAWLLAYW